MEEYFSYELTPYSLSLFKDGMMRSPDKVELRKKILLEEAMPDPRNTHVTDGVMVLYKTSWSKHINNKELCQHYVREVRGNYGNSIIVFDGYENNTTKDHAHVKRRKKTISNIEIDESISVTVEKDEFLSNKHKKSKLIEMMKKYFLSDGLTVHVLNADADTDIVKTALEINHI